MSFFKLFLLVFMEICIPFAALLCNTPEQWLALFVAFGAATYGMVLLHQQGIWCFPSER